MRTGINTNLIQSVDFFHIIRPFRSTVPPAAQREYSVQLLRPLGERMELTTSTQSIRHYRLNVLRLSLPGHHSRRQPQLVNAR